MTFDLNRGMHSAHTSASGRNFHIPSTGLSSSDTTSPTYYNSQRVSNDSQSSNNGSSEVQIYCARCRRPNALKDCFACTECISGFCSECVYYLSSDHRTGPLQLASASMNRGKPCPHCHTLSARYKAFRLEIR